MIKKATLLSLIKKTFFWLMRALYLQSALLALSFPLILYWGLPFSYLTYLGNIIFTPFLVAFLLVSSLIFFCELCHIPNTLFIIILEKIQTIWRSLVSWSNEKVLLELPAPPTICLIALFLCTVCILYYRTSSTKKSLILCTMMIFTSITLRSWSHYLSTIITFEKMPHLTIIRKAGKTLCIDEGLHRFDNKDSWLMYTFYPELRRHCGTSSIDTLILLKPSAASFTLAKSIFKNSYDKVIILPSVDYCPPTLYKALQILKAFAQQQRHTLLYIKEAQTMNLDGFDLKTKGLIKRTKKFIHPLLQIILPSGSISAKPTIRTLLMSTTTTT